MPKARRNPELFSIVGRKHLTDPLPECGRTSADIHGDVEQRASGAANKLALGVGFALEMQSAYGALPDAQRFIILDEGEITAMLGEEIRAEGFREIAPLIADMPRYEEFDAGNVKGLN